VPHSSPVEIADNMTFSKSSRRSCVTRSPRLVAEIEAHVLAILEN
jgi:hypothetical protein